MKILITTDLYNIATNGVVTSVRSLHRALTAQGHDVRILTLSDSLHTYTDGAVSYVRSMPVGFIYPQMRVAISYRNDVLDELIAWSPNIIHTQCEFSSYQFALYISKKLNIPIIHTYHTMYEEYVHYILPGKRLGKYVVRTLSRKRLKRASCIIAPTEKVADTLEAYGLRNQICIVASGIPLEQHKSRLSEEMRSKRREQLGIPSDHQVVLNLGRLGKEKNLEELIRYFAAALHKNSKMTLLIVGDGPARKDLEVLSAELGLGGHVKFTGMVPPSEVQDYYQLADVFASASISETQGLTYLEAEANGLPLLCRQDSCLSGILLEGENGYSYTEQGDFCEKLSRILNDKLWHQSAGRRSEEISEQYGTAAFASNVAGVYRKVLSI